MNFSHPSNMILISILTAPILISTTTSAPLQYKAFPRTGNSFLLVNRWIPDLQNEMLSTSQGSELSRTKRIGSLSIMNPLDVLRQKVLSELAWKKALQDQRQIDANRRYLESIGKRSVRPYNAGLVKNLNQSMRNGWKYTIDEDQDQDEFTEKLSQRTQDLMHLGDPVFREDEDQSRKVQTSEML